MSSKSIIQNAILFEDNHLIAINKQPGQLVQGDKTSCQKQTPIWVSFKISNSSPIIWWYEIPNKTNHTLIKKQFQIAKKPSYPIKLRFLFNAILCWKLN